LCFFLIQFEQINHRLHHQSAAIIGTGFRNECTPCFSGLFHLNSCTSVWRPFHLPASVVVQSEQQQHVSELQEQITR
jgi:hypothetical protein